MKQTLRKWASYLSLIVIIIYVITGYGMTHQRFMKTITFDLLNKPLASQIHAFLIIPLIITILAHLYFSCCFVNKLKQGFKKQTNSKQQPKSCQKK